MAAANTLRLEVYTVEGKPVGEPQLLPNLDDDLAVAIEAELFHELLKSKGIDIPLL
ncbi:hypothetical protein APY03_0734 [Variovorax sp. WDL1]|nr:hypothetical protein APY03_0734 [Variovorax sp. WDL1]